jgi:ribose-phosphate pyrophosphokinase
VPPASPFEIHAFADGAAFAARLARALGAGPTRRVTVSRFPDGERLVRVAAPCRRRALLVRSLHAPDEKLLEVLLAADALRRSGATREVTLVAPYLPYLRQDRAFRPGEPVSASVIGGVLGRAFTRVVTVEPHLHRIARLADVVPGRATALPAAPALARWLARGRARPILVAPDAEAEPWVRALGAETGLPWLVGRKERLGDRRVRVELPALPPGAHALLVDDVASTGATLVAAARALRARGAQRVDAVVVHALFAPGALGRLRAAGVRSVVSTDTVPHRTNAIPVAGLVADALRARGRGRG